MIASPASVVATQAAAPMSRNAPAIRDRRGGFA
jgi:hypothetical protein